jgi:septum formation protein
MLAFVFDRRSIKILNEMIQLPKLVLASGSPRRAEILRSVGWDFVKDAPDVDESELDGETPEDYVLRLAATKAAAVSGKHPDQIILGADTTVVISGEIVGKPTDIADARRMIEMLKGNSHEVLTGVAVVKNGSTKTGLERTLVNFSRMSEAEINFLVEKGDPLDKAGAYAVQAQAALFIEGIVGDYWNVVGLPIGLVYRMIMHGPAHNKLENS